MFQETFRVAKLSLILRTFISSYRRASESMALNDHIVPWPSKGMNLILYISPLDGHNVWPLTGTSAVSHSGGALDVTSCEKSAAEHVFESTAHHQLWIITEWESSIIVYSKEACYMMQVKSRLLCKNWLPIAFQLCKSNNNIVNFLTILLQQLLLKLGLTHGTICWCQANFKLTKLFTRCLDDTTISLCHHRVKKKIIKILCTTSSEWNLVLRSRSFSNTNRWHYALL